MGLEALCNIGAAEILMPIGSLPALEADDVGMETLTRGSVQRFDVS